MKETIIRVLRAAWRERVKFTKYFIVGVSGFAIDISLLFIFVEWFHLTPTLAVISNQVIVLGFNFTLNKYWSFGSTGSSRQELIRYLILATWNYLFSVGAMHYGHEVLGLPYLLVRVVSIACMVLWNFALFKLWVYREKK